jgi:hypothetical protein
MADVQPQDAAADKSPTLNGIGEDIYKAPAGKVIKKFAFGDRNNLHVYFTDGTEIWVHVGTLKSCLKDEVLLR